ncbi:hypothetical protein E2542_SST11313 [Spatholobus suberectus]|nr:hypothetical protein E2542_SST11313 [Spatholobus suberectus]
MDQRELHPGICYKLYLFIMKTLASQAMKTVTLGGSSHYGSSSTEVQITQRGFGTKEDKVVRAETPCEGHFGGSVSPNIEEKNIPCRNNIDGNEVARENVLGDLPHAPKKMVSINDNVEEIILPSKKRSKSFQKYNSLDQQEHPKPLRSILKVGSNLNDKSNSIC